MKWKSRSSTLTDGERQAVAWEPEDTSNRRITVDDDSVVTDLEGLRDRERLGAFRSIRGTRRCRSQGLLIAKLAALLKEEGRPYLETGCTGGVSRGDSV